MDALDQALGDYKLKGLKLHPVSYVGFPFGEATLTMVGRVPALLKYLCFLYTFFMPSLPAL